MAIDPEGPAANISGESAEQLLARATPSGRRLLQLFAEHQVLSFELLKETFGTSQKGLNALMGRLSLLFLEIQGDSHFYIYLPEPAGWAVSRASRRSLRRALKRDEAKRQRSLGFLEES